MASAKTRGARKAIAPIRISTTLVWTWEAEGEEWVLPTSEAFFFVARDPRDRDKWDARYSKKRHASSWWLLAKGEGLATAHAAREAVHELLRGHGYLIPRNEERCNS